MKHEYPPPPIPRFPKVEMDKGFACLPKDGGGYYSSRAVVEESTSDDASNVSGSLPLRLKVR